MKKFIFLVILTPLAFGSSVIHEIQRNSLVRSAIAVAMRASYRDTKTIHKAVRLLNTPQVGTALEDGKLGDYFHDAATGVLTGYVNSFETAGGVKGCIYSIDHEELRQKIFIAFPGTRTSFEWFKNLFEIASFKNNIQKSYDEDITVLYEDNRSESFLRALYQHINFKNSSYHDLDRREDMSDLDTGVIPKNLIAYEYYFTGHSRGGGLALLAGRRFKERFERATVKVATFCSPKLTNAHVEQLRFVEILGFQNIAHFIRPTDIVPHFPFRYVTNYGINIPLVFNIPWYLRYIPLYGAKRSHHPPSEEEVDLSVRKFNQAQSIGLIDPFFKFFSLEPKPLLWAVGSAASVFFFIEPLREKLLEIILDWLDN